MRAPITLNQCAGHAIRIKLPVLAGAIVEEHYRLRPELQQRYGERGMRYCREDAEFHLHFLATSVEMGDGKIFADYVAWVTDLLERRGIPASDVAENVRVLERVLGANLPTELLAPIRSSLEAALHPMRYDSLTRQR